MCLRPKSSIIASITTALVLSIIGIRYYPKYCYTITKEINAQERDNYKSDLIFPFGILLFVIVSMLLIYLYGL
jgi:hypothetical protein